MHNLVGQRLINQTMETSNGALNVASLPAGVYIVKWNQKRYGQDIQDIEKVMFFHSGKLLLNSEGIEGKRGFSPRFCRVKVSNLGLWEVGILKFKIFGRFCVFAFRIPDLS